MENFNEGENLKRLLKLHGVRNRQQFARDHGIKGGSNFIYQHMHGIRPIGLEAGIAYAKAFGCTLAEISPRLDNMINSILELRTPAKKMWPFSLSYDQFLEIDEPMKSFLDGQIDMLNTNMMTAYHDQKKKKMAAQAQHVRKS